MHLSTDEPGGQEGSVGLVLKTHTLEVSLVLVSYREGRTLPWDPLREGGPAICSVPLSCSALCISALDGESKFFLFHSLPLAHCTCGSVIACSEVVSKAATLFIFLVNKGGK